MFCPKCGNEIEENAKFCAKCGYRVTQFNEVNSNADVPVHKSDVEGVKFLGNFNGVNTSLYVDPDTGDVIAVYGHMGYEVLTYISKNGNTLTVSEQPYRELGPDEDYYQTPYPIEYIYVGDGAE